MKFSKNLFAILMMIILYSCREPAEPIPLRSPLSQTPIITGLVRVDEQGSILSVWGKPSEPEGPKVDPIVDSNGMIFPDRLISMKTPYPNPSNGFFTIQFSIGREADVIIWIVRAKLPNEPNQSSIIVSNSIVKITEGLSIKTISEQPRLKAGYHRVIWDATDDFGEFVPSGVYRVFVKVNDLTIWRDIMVAWKAEDVPNYIWR